jgi:DNA polymerase III epsilon subunit-like protein
MAPTYTVYFDTETGGVEPHRPTIQLAAVAVALNGEEAGSFSQNIAFNEADADPTALALNHYTPQAWSDAVSPGVTISRFSAWLRPYQSVTLISKRTGNPYTVARLAGYNALTFDLPRLKAMFGTQFFPCEYLVRDVLQRALFYFDEHDAPKPDNFKLATVCQMFGIDTDGAHGALADARMSARLHRAIQEAS